MTHPIAFPVDPALPVRFADSVLGLYLDQDAAAVFAMGSLRNLAPGTPLAAGAGAALHVVLDGRLAGRAGWYGPGNHITTEALRQHDTDLAVADLAVRLWTLDLEAPAWQAPGNRPLRVALLRALGAAEAAEAAGI